jgi:hypothetical protein
LYFKEISPSDKRFSHLGVVHITSDSITVINAEGLALEGRDFVNEVTLHDFLEIARSIGIYRLRNYDGELISQSAVEYTGRDDLVRCMWKQRFPHAPHPGRCSESREASLA